MNNTAQIQRVSTECQINFDSVRINQNSKRLFHGRGGRWAGLEWCVIDVFFPCLLVTFFRQPPEGFEAELIECLQEQFVNRENVKAIQVQRRYLEGAPISCEYGELESDWYAQRENLRFCLSSTQQNIGFFLDIEPARQWLETQCEGKRVLNLFSYTCAFSVVAVANGAEQVINIDMSSRSLSVGRDNHRLNQLDLSKVSFLPHNIFKSWGKLRKNGPYDIVIIDPPSYQKGSFIAEKDYAKVLRKMAELVSNNGCFLACLNAPEVKVSAFQTMVEAECPEFTMNQRLTSTVEFTDSEPDRALKMLVFSRCG